MAASVLHSNRYHVRSTSLPSGSHPISENVKENLKQLRQWESLSLTSSSSLCTGLSGLCDLYQSIDDLLQLPLTQQALVVYVQKKCIDEVLEGSVRLLDACGTARDAMLQMTDAVKDLHLAVRRRGATKTEMEIGFSTYMSSIKKIKQNATKSLKALKTEKLEFSSLPNGSQHLVEVMSVLREARSLAIDILEQLLSYVSVSKPRSMKKSVVFKWFSSGRVACEADTQNMNETERMQATLSVICSHKSEKDNKQVQDAQELLNAFIGGTQRLEVGLDLLQRRLIHTRVFLLDIFTH
ncbi:uncharacterized protein [Aristolochia californica]|uniref:uncharacterized protein n=1 Tax=Aristolochia californica TaxID=171875 RepID=UPI0035DC4520